MFVKVAIKDEVPVFGGRIGYIDLLELTCLARHHRNQDHKATIHLEASENDLGFLSVSDRTFEVDFKSSEFKVLNN